MNTIKTVLITGANHGLGLSLTKIFLEHNYMVFAGVYHYNKSSQINSIEDRENLYLLDMDVTDIDTVKEAAHLVGKHTDFLDVLINNAGIIPYDENQDSNKTIFDELDYNSVNAAIDVNAIGTLRVTNVFSPFLKNKHGSLVVNISSEAGSISDCSREKWFGYCMSKAAQNMCGTLIHNNLKKYGGAVFQIHPGYMQTYMHGEKNEEATYTADFSAEKIFQLIQNKEQYQSEDAVYMDLFGERLNW